MLDELTFYQYFLNLDDELYRHRKNLEKRVKNNVYDFGAYDLLREINARIDEHQKIYNDLKGFFDIERNLLIKLNTEK